MWRAVTRAVLLLSLLAPACAPVKDAPRPHIVLILADDLGWRDVGYHGGDYPTPTIDQLAARGTRLESFYVQPLCSPTRAAILTGRFPLRYGLQSCALRPWAEAGLPLEERTLAEALRDAGYATAIVGKWHLGHHARAFLPTERGFERQYGPYNGGVHYVTHKRMGALDWHRDDEPLEEEGYATTLIAEEAVRIVREHDEDRPLFLYVPFTAVHSPRSAPIETTERFAHLEPEARRVYAAMVSILDDGVASILRALERKGIADDTLVLFGSDNGGAKGLGDNRPLRGFKGQLGDGGIRTSWLARWPGQVREGAVVEHAIHAVDLFPTLVGLAGGSTRGELDGVDVWSTLARGEPRGAGDLLLYSGPRGGALRSGDLKLVIERSDSAPETQLFDVVADPGETVDLAGERLADVERMRAVLDAWAERAVPSLRVPVERPDGFVAPAIWGVPE